MITSGLLQGGGNHTYNTPGQMNTLLEFQKPERSCDMQTRLAFLDIKGVRDTVARDWLWLKCLTYGGKFKL